MTALAANLRFGAERQPRRSPGATSSHVRQIPEKLIDVTVQPLMFVILFAYVFGGAIAVPGGNYHEYLMGGIFVQTLVFGIMGPATSMATTWARASWTASARCRWRGRPSWSATSSPSSPPRCSAWP